VNGALSTPVELVLVAGERHAEFEAARGARVLTLRELASRLAEAERPDFRETSAEATRLLARQTLPGQPAALALAVDGALGQLRRAGTLASDLSRVAGARSALLRTALERTDARLSELRLRDHRQTSWLAARALPGLSIPELDGVLRARVRGLSNFENGDLALLEALHEKLRANSAGGVVIELPTLPDFFGTALRDAVAQLAARLEQRWAEELDHPELEFIDPRPEANPPLVIQAAHEASEARAVARTVLEALARGTALDRIAIVPVDAADAFLEPLRAELSAAKLPFSEAWSRPTSSAPEAHAALELLSLARGPLRRDALVDVLRVPDLELKTLLGEDHGARFIDVIARLPVRVDRTGLELLAALSTERGRCDPKRERELEAIRVAELALAGLLARFERLPNSACSLRRDAAFRKRFATPSGPITRRSRLSAKTLAPVAPSTCRWSGWWVPPSCSSRPKRACRFRLSAKNSPWLWPPWARAKALAEPAPCASSVRPKSPAWIGIS